MQGWKMYVDSSIIYLHLLGCQGHCSSTEVSTVNGLHFLCGDHCRKIAANDVVKNVDKWI